MPTLLVVDDAPVFPQGGKAMRRSMGFETIEAGRPVAGFRTPVNGS